jgi:hypothetical protein
MDQHHDRPAGDLEIAVRHADGGLFVHTGDEFRLSVLAVSEQRFVQAAEAGGRIGEGVFDVQGLNDVDHEIRSGRAADTRQLGRQLGLCGGELGGGQHRRRR